MKGKCQGGCGVPVTGDESWCASCWPEHTLAGIVASVVNDDKWTQTNIRHPDPVNRRTVAGASHRLRLDILQAAYSFAFGPGAERSSALEKLVHLAHVAQQEQEQGKEHERS